MQSYLPVWLIDIGTLCSVIGLLITVFLYCEARKIRESFLRKARLPEVIGELVDANKKIAKCLKDWPMEEHEGIRQFVIAVELMENIKKKLPDEERKKVSSYIGKTKERKYFLFKHQISRATADKAWELYSSLSATITSLQQLQKDSVWE